MIFDGGFEMNWIDDGRHFGWKGFRVVGAIISPGAAVALEPITLLDVTGIAQVLSSSSRELQLLTQAATAVVERRSRHLHFFISPIQATTVT
ncbi:hypothetical protein V5799_016601 [Amblyomma americanum]|uniref:Uncharacterized protein n=1 Tax=Amblyomma americanum TaxID=6943 RepID=A0AAQ4F5B6_AMBAM